MSADEASSADHRAGARAAALEAEIERLRQAVAARDSFLAVAAHELRNPMTPILGRVTLLRRMHARGGLDGHDLARRLEALEVSIVAFIKRATTLLDVSRMASERAQVERLPVNLSKAARAVADDLRPAAIHAGSDISVDCPDDPEVVALADPLAVEQVIENLVYNAIKYGDASPIRIAVARDAARAIARIAVSDEGPGISPESQARVFERFERAVGAGTSKTGYGVGLWLVRNLCEAMMGRIDIESAPDQGATFTVSLPLHISEDAR